MVYANGIGNWFKFYFENILSCIQYKSFNSFRSKIESFDTKIIFQSKFNLIICFILIYYNKIYFYLKCNRELSYVSAFYLIQIWICGRAWRREGRAFFIVFHFWFWGVISTLKGFVFHLFLTQKLWLVSKRSPLVYLDFSFIIPRYLGNL